MMDHGAGVSHASTVEYVLVVVAAVVMVWTLVLALRYTLRPHETDPEHIKHRILDDELDHAQEARRP